MLRRPENEHGMSQYEAGHAVRINGKEKNNPAENDYPDFKNTEEFAAAYARGQGKSLELL